ncbi:hypothetical protein F5Y18DRAFT_429144 [Xylariaceae sp. FL1019]|nr:hypothetical protein F5Y18DRAFT_429144 [Xylariaceae sp. FL1019]
MTSDFKSARASWMFADPYTYQYSDIDKNEPISPIFERHPAPTSATATLAELEGSLSFTVEPLKSSTQTVDSAVKLDESISQAPSWSIPDCLTPGGSSPCEIVKLVRTGTSSEPSSPCGLSRSRNSIARGTQRSINGRQHLRSVSSLASLTAPKHTLYRSASSTNLVPIYEDFSAPEVVPVPSPSHTSVAVPSARFDRGYSSYAYDQGLIPVSEVKNDWESEGNGSFDAILSKIDQGVTKRTYAKRVRNSRYIEKFATSSN